MENQEIDYKRMEQAMISLVRHHTPMKYVGRLLKRYRPKCTKEDIEDCTQEIFYKMCMDPTTIRAYEDNGLWTLFMRYCKFNVRNWAIKDHDIQSPLDSIEEEQEKDSRGEYSLALVTPETDAWYDEVNRLYSWDRVTKKNLTEEFIMEHSVQWDWNRMIISNWIEEEDNSLTRYIKQHMTEDEKNAYIQMQAGSGSIQEVNIYEKMFNLKVTTENDYLRSRRLIEMYKNGKTPQKKYVKHERRTAKQ